MRHAQTEWSVQGRHTGRTDIPLTDAGRASADRLAARLPDGPFDPVWTSPLSRARETCERTGLANATVREELLEWDYGDYEGLTTLEIRERRPGWWLWRDGCPHGECAADVGERVDPLIDALASRQQANSVLFAHGHLLRILTARWLGLQASAGALLALGTASISVLGWERETRVVWRWNDTEGGP